MQYGALAPGAPWGPPPLHYDVPPPGAFVPPQGYAAFGVAPAVAAPLDFTMLGHRPYDSWAHTAGAWPTYEGVPRYAGAVRPSPAPAPGGLVERAYAETWSQLQAVYPNARG